MTTEYVFGYHTAIAFLKNKTHKILKVYLLKDRNDARFQEIEKLLQEREEKISLKILDRKQLENLIGNVAHQGIVLEVEKNIVNYTSFEEFLSGINISGSLFLILDGILDPHNLGACLRTANAAGVTAVIVPKDNAVGVTPVVRKVASGAAEVVPFFQVTNLARTMQTLKDNNIWIYGAVLDAAKTIYEIDFSSGSVAIVLGAEEKGLRRLTREYCDELMKIPMIGSMPSLNVSVATGICLFEAVRQRR
jgi:23S rRNA (guanosine2251-2'-O)-methyltransferase